MPLRNRVLPSVFWLRAVGFRILLVLLILTGGFRSAVGPKQLSSGPISVSTPAWATVSVGAEAGPGSSVSALARPVSEMAGSTNAEPPANPHQPAASPIQSVSPLIRSAAGSTACRFSGRARLHLAPAPPGIEVEAWVDGVKVAKGTTTQDGDITVYRLTVDGAYAGKMVIFRFAGYPGMLLGQALCAAGAEQVVDLDEMVIGGCGGH
jgi:hypothetical protein